MHLGKLMRVSTNQMQLVAVNSMLDQQSKLSKIQHQVATGRKITRPSDDPVASAKVVKLQDILHITDQFQNNVVRARTRLNLEEGVLSSIVKAYHRIRELTLQANNSTQTNETRSYISQEIEQLLEEVVSLANSTDSTGEFLFSGNKGSYKPFGKNSDGGYDYQGDDGQRAILIGPKRQILINDTGNDVFREIRDGNGKFTILDSPNNKGTGVIDPGSVNGKYDLGTYAIVFDKKQSADPNEPITYGVMNDKSEFIIPQGQVFEEGNAIDFAGVHTFLKGEPEAGDFYVIRPSIHKDIFTTLTEFTKQLRTGLGTKADQAKFNNNVNRNLVAMDVALNKTLEVRANIGARLNAIDSQEDINEALTVQIKGILSNTEDLDYGKAVSELNLKLTGLEASQKAFTRVQDITMFDYL